MCVQHTERKRGSRRRSTARVRHGRIDGPEAFVPVGPEIARVAEQLRLHLAHLLLLHLRLQIPHVVVRGLLGQGLVEDAKLARAPRRTRRCRRAPQTWSCTSRRARRVHGQCGSELTAGACGSQIEEAKPHVTVLRSLGTQLGRLLVDADHLQRETLQPGLRVERLVVMFDPLPQLSNPAAPRLRAEEPKACRGDHTEQDMHTEHGRTHTHRHASADTHAGH